MNDIVHPNESFLRLHGNTTDAEWLALLIRSCTEPVIDNLRFPSFPEAQFQLSVGGSAGPESLKLGFDFYREIKHYAARLGIPMDRSTRALDFGCGWGRHYRMFLKDLSTERFIGVDVDPARVELCRRLILVGCFETCNSRPPLPFDQGSLDLIYAYSVFSHLAESVQLKWIEEFGRLLRRGGMLIVSTLHSSHVAVWQQRINEAPAFWNTLLPNFNMARAKKQSESGEFLYCATGGGGPLTSDFYGEAIISPEYVDRHWSTWFDPVDYVDDPARGPQALIVVKRR